MTNDYLPAQFRKERFLKPEGDMSDQTWDEAALRRWEVVENGGREWEGRLGSTTIGDTDSMDNRKGDAERSECEEPGPC